METRTYLPYPTEDDQQHQIRIHVQPNATSFAEKKKPTELDK